MLQYFALFALLFGLVLGSFGNVLILRMPEGKSINGRSKCPRCSKEIAWHDLIPVISFLWLRGRCRSCRERISWQYPLVEAISGGLFLLAYFHEGGRLMPALFLGLTLWLFFLESFLDARTGLLPDALTMPLLFLSIVFAALSSPFSIYGPIIGAAFFGLQWLLSRGRWVGSGDIFIGAAMGFLLLDWRLLVLALFAAYIIGALFASVLLMFRSKKLSDHLPFVPFLALGTLVALLWGAPLLAAFPF